MLIKHFENSEGLHQMSDLYYHDIQSALQYIDVGYSRLTDHHIQCLIELDNDEWFHCYHIITTEIFTKCYLIKPFHAHQLHRII